MTRSLGQRFSSCLAVFAATSLVACSEPAPVLEVVVHEQVITVQLLGPAETKAVDILFVIDDSASMAGVQANLAANFGSFIDVLEDPSVEADYRVAVTTTDSGNPRCAGDTSDRGALLLSSCTQRQADFVNGDVDVRDVACTDLCTLTAAELEIVPTVTEHDDVARARPWLQKGEGETNLPPGVSIADAFACFAPQGIAGCDFEAPLESLYLALDRVLDRQDPGYGFLRADAITMIVFMTDGHDCSYAEDWADIFSPAGNRVFWSDPAAAAPTSASCWNAGVECVGDPGQFDSCAAVDKDIEGELASTDERAVLHPVDRYIDRVQALEDVQRERHPQREVIVALVGGVGNDGSPSLAEADDPAVQDAYGIGPGCTGPGDVAALPPVRLLEFSAAFTPDHATSICNADYTPALQAIAEKVGPSMWPACFSGCVEDRDRTSVIVDPECVVEQRPPGRANEWLAECERDGEGRYVIDPATSDYAMPADDVDACYAILVDEGGSTADVADDMSMECVDLNYNLEFKISRRPGHPAHEGTTIFASCSGSDSPAIDCPNLGMPS